MGIGLGSIIQAGMGIQFGLSSYRSAREQGDGRLKSALGAYVNARVQSDPWIMAGTLAVPIIKKYAIEKPHQSMRAIRRNFSTFAKGMMPDNELLGQMQGAQLQSAVMANNSLSLAGKSWAGTEASVFHARYK